MLAHVPCELVDPLGEEGDLHFRGACIALRAGMLLDNGVFLFLCYHLLTPLYHATNYWCNQERVRVMGRVAIITDSTACIPTSVRESLGIKVLPLFLEFEQATYQDGLSDSAASFYKTLASAKRPPTTGAPAPGAYADAMVAAGRDASAVLVITVSAQFSAMYDAAVQGMALAKERQPELDVRVLDSDAAAMAQGFVAIDAARAANEGGSIETVMRQAEALKPNVQLLVALDTLTYLGRSGRVPRLLIWASSPLQVKPVVTFSGGKYRPIALARSSTGMRDRLFKALEQRGKRGKLHVCIHHTNAPEQAAALADRVRSTLEPVELFLTELTQVMGVHTGPGLLGFAFYNET